MSIQAIYTCIATFVEVVAYSILLGMAVTTTENHGGTISSISESMSLSIGVSVYYAIVIYIFSFERNGYEFYVDPYKRLEVWNTNKYLYSALWLRIILLNIFMIFLLLVGVITTSRDSKLHGQVALCSIIFHLLFETTCIGIRSYGISINKPTIIKNRPLYIFLLCTEAIAVIAATLTGLCFVSVLPNCPVNSDTIYISEYVLYFIVISTPIYRLLD